MPCKQHRCQSSALLHMLVLGTPDKHVCQRAGSALDRRAPTEAVAGRLLLLQVRVGELETEVARLRSDLQDRDQLIGVEFQSSKELRERVASSERSNFVLNYYLQVQCAALHALHCATNSKCKCSSFLTWSARMQCDCDPSEPQSLQACTHAPTRGYKLALTSASSFCIAGSQAARRTDRCKAGFIKPSA